MRENARGGTLKTAAVLALAALFFLLSVGSALLGSGVYRRVAAETAAVSDRRTALSYLANQLRRADARGGISVGRCGDSDALFLADADTAGYSTCIYCYGGALRELYADESAGLAAADGVELLALSGLSVTADGAALTLTVTGSDGVPAALTVTPRYGYEVRP